MQSKCENFNALPEVPKIETAQYLSNRELVNFSMTSKYHLKLFQPLIDVRKLLHYLTRGEHHAVKAMLKKDISLMYKRGVVMDCSGRKFENVSPFEYALWALDKHMWAAMIACIPQNEASRKVFARLIVQYNKVNTDGVTYKLNGKTITEQHFDFKNTIIKELQTHVDSLNTPGVKNEEAIDKQWREGVGGAQKLLPMHVVIEYCSEERFYPLPTFTSQPKSSNHFYNSTTEKNENWFSVDSKLSVNFAIYKGVPRNQRVWTHAWQCTAKCCPYSPLSLGVCTNDLVAMTALCKVRTNDFIVLKSQLEAQMTPDHHHQVSNNSPN